MIFSTYHKIKVFYTEKLINQYTPKISSLYNFNTLLYIYNVRQTKRKANKVQKNIIQNLNKKEKIYIS